MSYALIPIVLLLAATFASSTSNVHVQGEQSVYLRFFPNFAQLFHPAKADFNASHDDQGDIEHYQFSFTEKAFGQIVEETLTILNVDVNERTIVHHPAPNFETVGSRYFYRRDPKEREAVEIELVNVDDRLFREVRQPNRFFYLPTLDGLEYAQRMPVMPFYDVSFTCNVSRMRHFAGVSPLLSYIDRNFQWTPRYTLDIRGTPTLDGYADIRNNGDHTVIIEGLELVAGRDFLRSNLDHVLSLGDVKLEGGGNNFAYSTSESFLRSYGGFVRSMDKEASGTYVYETSVPSAFALSPHSTRSVQFFQANITIDALYYYSAEFSPVNARGKLLNAYNITSHLSFIPRGQLSLHREGRFLGQGNLPDLAVGETHTMLFGHDADVSYQRLVSLLEGDEQSESITYQVEYIFQNDAANSVARIDFVESFGSYKYFQIKTFIAGGHQHGTDLRAHLIVPPLASRRAIRYQVEIFKIKPIFNAQQ